MKKKLTTVVILLLLGLVVYSFWPKEKDTPDLPKQPSKSSNSGGDEKSVAQNKELSGRPVSHNPVRATVLHRPELLDEWKQPINFYGRVEDPLGESISQASVRLSWTDLSKTGTSQRLAKSDENGLFSLENVQGKSLSVLVEKGGYRTNARKSIRSYEYALEFEKNYHQPDKNQPVIFVLHPVNKAKELIISERRLEVPIGETKSIQLMKSNLVGGFQASVFVEMDKQEYERPFFPWGVNLYGKREVFFLPTSDYYTLEAPHAGYLEDLHFEFPLSELNNRPKGESIWPIVPRRTIYIKTKDGLYGAIKLTMYRKEKRGYVILKFRTTINPTGSRNLDEG